MSDKDKDGQKFQFAECCHPEQMAWLAQIIDTAQKQEFYGQITIDFKKGYMTEVSQNKTFKPPKV